MLQSCDKIYQLLLFYEILPITSWGWIRTGSTQQGGFSTLHTKNSTGIYSLTRVSWLLKLSCPLCFLLLLGVGLSRIPGPGPARPGRASGTRSHFLLECVPACVEIISFLNKRECSMQQTVDENIRHHGE